MFCYTTPSGMHAAYHRSRGLEKPNCRVHYGLDRSCMERHLYGGKAPSARLLMDALHQRRFWFQVKINDLGRRRKYSSKSAATQSCHTESDHLSTADQTSYPAAQAREEVPIDHSVRVGGESSRAGRSEIIRGATPLRCEEHQAKASPRTEATVPGAEEAGLLHKKEPSNSKAPEGIVDDLNSDRMKESPLLSSSALPEEPFGMGTLFDGATAPMQCCLEEITGNSLAQEETIAHTDGTSAEKTADLVLTHPFDETNTERDQGLVQPVDGLADSDVALNGPSTAAEAASETELAPDDSNHSLEAMPHDETESEHASAIEHQTLGSMATDSDAKESTEHEPTRDELANAHAQEPGTLERMPRRPLGRPRRISDVFRVPTGQSTTKRAPSEPAKVTSVELGRQRLDILYAIRRGWRPGKSESEDGATTADVEISAEDLENLSCPEISMDENTVAWGASPTERTSDRAAFVDPAEAGGRATSTMGIIGLSRLIRYRMRLWFLHMLRMVFTVLNMLRSYLRTLRKPRT